jgi:hypothetical protein
MARIGRKSRITQGFSRVVRDMLAIEMELDERDPTFEPAAARINLTFSVCGTGNRLATNTCA